MTEQLPLEVQIRLFLHNNEACTTDQIIEYFPTEDPKEIYEILTSLEKRKHLRSVKLLGHKQND